MEKREYSLLNRIYHDKGAYHCFSMGDVIRYYSELPATKALMRDYGYGHGSLWSAAREIYDTLCYDFKTPDTLYPSYFGDKRGHTNILYDCYKHDGERLKRCGWVKEWLKQRQTVGLKTEGLYLTR